MKLTIALTFLVAFATASQAMEPLPRSTPLRISLPQSLALEQQYPSLADCGALQDAYHRAGWPSGSGVEVLRAIDARVKRQMILRHDRGGDRWTPLAAQILRRERPAGDCDEISITAAQLAVCAGVPARNIGLMITDAPDGNQGEMHMVAFFRDAAGRNWVFGDSFGPVRPLSHLREEVFYFANLTDVGNWFGMMAKVNPRSGSARTATASTP